MDGHDDTSEEAKSAADLESEVEVPEHDAAHAPCRCSRTSSVRLGHIPRDDKGKAGCTGKLPSHKYKTLTPAAGFLLTWASEGPLWVTPPTSKEACVQDRHPRDGPRDQPIELCVEDPRGSINPRRKF
ncbi:hypothetical protein BHM03_00055647 [Ensete ventricosum]|nr:hypothetical protein BHM03_00055647 [Ensete ventricosum]